MRSGPVVVVCSLLLLASCGGGSSPSPPPSVKPPVANAGGPYTATAGTAVSFSGAASTDPQGEMLTYSWNFGDNGTGTGVSPTHTYATAGTYTVTLTVTNTSNLTATATSTATIAAPPPVALTGLVYGGLSPIVGAHVYLFAANTTGYGGAGIAASSSNASVSLLSASETGTSDSVGAYVATGSNGGFSLTGDYSCTNGQQLYLYALGGGNAAAGLMAAIGSCPASGANAITVTVNEVTTIAAAYAFAGFATDATHVSSSGTALAQVGIANAFANAANLASLTTGAALATTPAGTGTVPQTEINTLANILASCVNAGTWCSTLLSTATSDGTAKGTKPTDTATAAINIAHYPGENYPTLISISSSAPIFSPTITSGGDLQGSTYGFSIILVFTGGGLTGGRVAIDGLGNVWALNPGFPLTPGEAGTTVTELSSSGSFLSGANGYTGGGLNGPVGIAIDASGNAWITNEAGNSVTVLSGTGSILSGTNGYTGGGLSDPDDIAIDGSGNAWIANYSGNSVTRLFSTGSPVSGSPYTGGDLSAPMHVAIDSTGNVWVANYASNSVTEFNNSGTILSGANGYASGGNYLYQPNGIAIDGSGNAWVSNLNQNEVTKISSSGIANEYSEAGAAPVALAFDGSGNLWDSSSWGISVLFPSTFTISSLWAAYNGSGSVIANCSLAIDGSGNIWEGCNHYVAEFIGAATPVITPLSAGVKNNTLGTRP